MQSIRRWWRALSTQLPFGRRSNGIRVGRETIAHIKAGNAARGRQKWSAAAIAYRRALATEPHLQHVWMQLGHMEKEAGEVGRAAIAYAEAARLNPEDATPLLHLGHMAKTWRQPAEAAAHFVGALRRAPRNLEATSELVRLMPDRDEIDPALWSDILDVLDIDPNERAVDDTGELPSTVLVFDVTDLLAFFGHHRLPTGIQRVQIEVSLACLEKAFDVPMVFCVYSSARRGWIRLAQHIFEDICHLARQSDDVADPAWITRLDRTYRHIAVSRTVRFPHGTMLINLGASWSDRNYLLDVRVARACQGIIYIPFVHDLIPIIGPQWCMDTLTRDYRAWLGSLLHTADAYLANSESTRADLLRVAAEWGAPIPASSVAVIRLDGDFSRPAAPSGFLEVQGLKSQPYVLFVSTLEPRKNHLGAFLAWLALADLIGEAAMPRLVCVGGRGWLNEDLYRLLNKQPRLRRMVRILHGIPDDALATLYEHCLFAFYPSFYEGWGLPVSEALSYGKVPAISRVSSLPEAGGTFARYFNPADIEDIAAAVRALLDADVRTVAEDAIRKGYRPRSWHAIARDLVAKAQTAPPRSDATLPCLAGTGIWTLALPRQPSGMDEAMVEARPGEMLRHGRAWQSPGLEGSHIEGNDAALWFRWMGLPGMTLAIDFVKSGRAVDVRVEMTGSIDTCRIEPGMSARIVRALPDRPATLRIGIVPLAGHVTVAKVVIMRDNDDDVGRTL